MITLRTSYLGIGMYVESLDRSWTATPPLTKSFMITDAEQVKQLQKYCQTVVIDEEKSDPVIRKDLLSYYKTHVLQRESIWKHITLHHKEYNLEIANEVYNSTLNSLRDIWNDFQLNKSTDAFKITRCVRRVINEMETNSDALALFGTLKSKQQDTAHHCLNVCILSVLFGRHLGIKDQQLFDLAYGALLHDIGEIKISQAILDKHHRGLIPEEKKELEIHTKYGAKLLSNVADVPKTAVIIARSHHERINGKGYPDDLEDIDIDYFARIVSIVDAYEIVINHPKAKSPISCSDALKSIYRMRDSFFDRDLVEEFMQCLGTYPISSVVELSNKEIGIVIRSKPEERLSPTVMIIKDSEKLLEQPEIINLAHIKPRLQIIKVLAPSSVGGGIDPSEYMIKQMGMEW